MRLLRTPVRTGAPRSYFESPSPAARDDIAAVRVQLALQGEEVFNHALHTSGAHRVAVDSTPFEAPVVDSPRRTVMRCNVAREIIRTGLVSVQHAWVECSLADNANECPPIHQVNLSANGMR
jgi:hypothetical protein